MKRCKGGCFRWARMWNSKGQLTGYRCAGCGRVKLNDKTK